MAAKKISLFFSFLRIFVMISVSFTVIFLPATAPGDFGKYLKGTNWNSYKDAQKKVHEFEADLRNCLLTIEDLEQEIRSIPPANQVQGMLLKLRSAREGARIEMERLEKERRDLKYAERRISRNIEAIKRKCNNLKNIIRGLEPECERSWFPSLSQECIYMQKAKKALSGLEEDLTYKQYELASFKRDLRDIENSFRNVRQDYYKIDMQIENTEKALIRRDDLSIRLGGTRHRCSELKQALDMGHRLLAGIKKTNPVGRPLPPMEEEPVSFTSYPSLATSRPICGHGRFIPGQPPPGCVDCVCRSSDGRHGTCKKYGCTLRNGSPMDRGYTWGATCYWLCYES